MLSLLMVSNDELTSRLGSSGDRDDATVITLRILVAEDDLFNQRVIRSALRRHGCEPDVVDDGRAAVEAVAGRHYDLVLMDIQMPHLDGLAATREICARITADRRPSIVALTSLTSEADRQACFAAGMLDVLHKPVDAPRLAEVLRACPRRGS